MKVAIADDHQLIRRGICDILKSRDIDVLFEAKNGKEMVEYAEKNHPNVVLMDCNMPVMNGWDATLALKTASPNTKVLALSMLDDDLSVIRMLRSGARGYLLKDADPDIIVEAIHSVFKTGYFHSDFVSTRMMKAMSSGMLDDPENEDGFNERELTFLELACTELTYKEIADKLSVSPRTVDGYRDSLFTKLGVKSRVGLVVHAIKYELIHV